MTGEAQSDESVTGYTALRYVDRIALRSTGDRVVSRATDALTGGPVLLKIALHGDSMREARALLEAPPETAPRLLDVGRLDDSHSFLAIEWLSGGTLLHPSPAHEAAETAVSLCALVARFHRGGWVHSDLKPGNVVRHEDGSLRLIDFGFAFRADQGPDEDSARGGSPGYAAPELTRGWHVDARIDQYSFGVTLRELFPALASDRAVAPVLERMMATLPSMRFAEMGSATLSLAGALGIDAVTHLSPRLGGGPLLERKSLLESLQRTVMASPGTIVLLHGAPGSGLSRAVTEIACDAVRAIELDATMSERCALAIVEEAIGSRTRLVVGIHDVSSDLRSLASTPRLRSALLRDDSRHVMIPRLSGEAFAGFVAHALGSESEPSGRNLHFASDGDLRLASELFARAVPGRGAPHGLAWELKSSLVFGSIPLRPPQWEQVPANEKHSLGALSHCGISPVEGVARPAVELIQGPGSFDALLAAGWIYKTEADRIAFTTQKMRSAAQAFTIDDAVRLDEWLLEHLHPDPDEPAELREAMARATRLGRAREEERLLRLALERAVSRGAYARYLALFESPDHDWTSEDVTRHAKRVASLLGEDWPEPRATHFLARALHRAGRPLGLVYLKQVALGEDRTAVLARYECLQALLNAHRREEHATLWSEFQAFLRLHEYPGLIELEGARAARQRGSRDEALRLATEAESKLTSWAPYYALDSILLQASMVSEIDPPRALGLLSRALARSVSTDRHVGILVAMAQLHELAGNFGRCATAAEEALEISAILRSERHHHRILAQRAWAWAMLDRTREAEADALRLLRSFEHRIEPARRATLHLLLGFTALHRGEVRRSYHSILTAWEATSAGASSMWRSIVQRSLADTCLDAEAWAVIPEAAAALGVERGDAANPSVARWLALLAQSADRSEDAVALLRGALPAIERTGDRIEAGRYLHHLGIAELGRGSAGARAGIEAFDRALQCFGEDGVGYFRGESLVGRAKVAALLGDRDASLRDLDHAIELTRRLQCRRTLANALRERTALLLRT